jgi:meso-butanediol dehydrogenase / (S,S)-butanediol dehydrogenase / diacetyl reductase
MMLEGKVAMITGAGAGIGVAIARRFVAEGAKICITGRRLHKLDEVVASLPVGTAIACAGDVSKLEDVKRMVATTVKFGGKIDILVNNAAIDPGGTIVDLDPEIWHAVMETNVTGPFYTMKVAIPHMIENGGGSIINISSLGGVRCLPTMAPYCTSKAALNMLTQQAAFDYGQYKIRVNAVLPGPVRTEMSEHSLGGMADAMGCDMDGVFKQLTCTIPLRRVSSPDEISGICAFLGSDDASFITATNILVDGGAAVVDPCGASLSMTGASGWGVSELR